MSCKVLAGKRFLAGDDFFQCDVCNVAHESILAYPQETCSYPPSARRELQTLNVVQASEPGPVHGAASTTVVIPANTGNQYAADSRLIVGVSGILGRPVGPGDDSWV